MTSLRDDIVEAFSRVPYPGDEHLTVYLPSGRKFDETFQLLRGRHWRDMPVAEFISGDTPIPDLTPEAFHFYLPGLLIASIDPNCSFNSDIACSLAFYLSPELAAQSTEPSPYEKWSQFYARMSRLQPAQREVIIRTLEEYVKLEWLTANDVCDAIQFFRRAPFAERILEERVSPDGFLKLLVAEAEDGDISIGLADSFWHTHADCIAHEFGNGPNAIAAYLEYLTSDRPVYVVRRFSGVVTAIFPSEDPKNEFRFQPPDERLEFRRWSGEKVVVETP